MSNRLRSCFALLTLSVLITAFTFTDAQAAPKSVVPHRLLVQFNSNVSPSDARNLLKAAGARAIAALPLRDARGAAAGWFNIAVHPIAGRPGYSFWNIQDITAHQEMEAVIRALNQWQPDLYLDLHVTDGSDYQYDITFGFNGASGHSPAIASWERKTFP